jgi:hypothetical protein
VNVIDPDDGITGSVDFGEFVGYGLLLIQKEDVACKTGQEIMNTWNP